MTTPAPTRRTPGPANPWLDVFRAVITTIDGARAVAVVAVVHLIAALLAYDPTPQTGGDDAAYRALAQALAASRGYVRLWEPGHQPETIYPPFFPWLLSLPVRAGFDSWAALNLFMVLLSVAFVVGAYLLLRRLLPSTWALACGLVVALSPGVIALSHQVLSDVPFSALIMLALWALHAIAPVDRPETGDARRMRWIPAVAVLSIVLAWLTRSAALPLALVAFAWLAWRRRWIPLAALCAILGPVALLWTRRGQVAGAAHYSDFIFLIDPYQPVMGRMNAAEWVNRFGANAAHYGMTHLPVLLFGTDYGLPVLAAWIVLALAVVGYALHLRRPDPSVLWLPLYIGLLLIWPATWSAERYLLPAYPLLLAYAVLALPLVRRWVPSSALAGAGALLVTAMLYADVGQAVTAHDCRAAIVPGQVEPCLANWGEYFTAVRAIRGHLPPGSAVLSRKPTLTYSESGYPSVTYPFSTAPDTLFAEARRVHADYLLLDDFPLAEKFLYGVVRDQPGRFCVVPGMKWNDTVLLRIQPVAGAGSADAESVHLKACTS